MLSAADIGRTKTDLTTYANESGAQAPLETGVRDLGYPGLQTIVMEFLERHVETNRSMRMATNAQPVVKKRAAKQSAWKTLASHYNTISNLHLRQLFADDPKRGARLTAEAVGLYLDYSKNRITDQTLELLIQLAEESGLR